MGWKWKYAPKPRQIMFPMAFLDTPKYNSSSLLWKYIPSYYNYHKVLISHKVLFEVPTSVKSHPKIPQNRRASMHNGTTRLWEPGWRRHSRIRFSQQKTTGKVVNVTILGGLDWLDFLSFWKLLYSYSCFVGLPVGYTLMCILSGPVLVFCNVR